MSALKALIMDFDGVVIDSNDAKDRAFAELCALYPDHGEAMMAYHFKHVSASRMVKIRYYVFELMARPGDQAAVEQMAAQYGGFVKTQVISSADVPGARDFLRDFSRLMPIYVASTTPEPELKEIIEAKGLTGYFTKVFGDPPHVKSEVIKNVLVAEGLAPEEVLFIGDTTSDWRYAHGAGLPFAGRDSGRGLECPGAEVFPDLFALAKWLRSDLGERLEINVG